MSTQVADMTEDEEYQRFLEELAVTCMADDAPCESCQAGGICDGPDLHGEWEDHE